MPTSTFQPTPEQLTAIHAVGRSVLVSAAAGSGKTAVLAERCAYLVCDAAPEHRCDVDQLLVLTFTEAAAAEMRGRIIDCIRGRLDASPTDPRLREQLALANAAHISTIHSFCLWLVRRWFTEAGIDPSAAVMDADEAMLLKREVLERVFNELYAFAASPDDPLGAGGPAATQPGPEVWSVDRWVLGAVEGAELAEAFLRLVDNYGLGGDAEITSFVLRLYEFTSSLPDCRAWLTQCVELPGARPQEVVASLHEELQTELRNQTEHVTQGMKRIALESPGSNYMSQLRLYADHLESWSAALEHASPGERSVAFDRVRESIERFEFPRASASRKRKSDGSNSGKELAAAFAEAARDSLFRDRLRKKFGLFSVEEWVDGLQRIAPYIATACDLVAAFHKAYAAEKRRLSVIDFADLERLAFELLAERSVGGTFVPSSIARALHERFAHVLVDEFQDINPLQEAILRLASRESSADLTHNFFAVGDIKQSIYRFRLAEPSIFADRLGRFRNGAGAANAVPAKGRGEALFLQRNFRSRPEILEAVNLVFGALMTGAGGVCYDEQAVLRAGRALDPPPRREPIEVHIVEKTVAPAAAVEAGDDELSDEGSATLDEPSEPRVADYANPAHWTPIEREAYLIGQRIRELMKPPHGSEEGDSPQFRDMAILLRATKVNAERMAAMLNAMGVPAHAEVGGSLFAVREVRDVIAALRVLDNVRQDIPLAAVLRSGIVGEQLAPDELVEVRLLEPRAPFHEVVRRYAKQGPEGGLRKRVGGFLDRVERYRERARRRPLSETLWAIYEDEGFLAHGAGLPNGPQRRANLIKLHELARKFDTFRLQGLHRFLKFLGSLEKEDRDVDVAPAVGESDNVVRIMSIHQSKGLEFPVVFVAGLGSQFNLGDRRGRLIFERSARIGLRVVDTEKMIEYPSAAHRLAAFEIERTSREEELRILYVAMTRSRDKLVLVGSLHDAESVRTLGTSRGPLERSSSFSAATAQTPLDWLLPVLHEHPHKIHVRGDQRLADDQADPLFTVALHTQSDIESWRANEPASAGEQGMRQAVAQLEPLPQDEPVATDDPEVQHVLDRLSFCYPYLATTSVKATLSASGVKAALAPAAESTQSFGQHFRFREFVPPPSKYQPAPTDEPAQRGTLTHRVLQHLDFEKATDVAGVASELQRLVQRGVLTAQECSAVDEDALAWFVSTPLAARIREAGNHYRRELRFVTSETVGDIDPSTAAPEEDRVLVRGIVDGIIVRPDGIEVIDFKTDAVTPGELEARAGHYNAQMDIYTRATSRLWGKPVRSCCLVFLAPRRIVSGESPAAQQQVLPGQQVFSWMLR